MENYKQAKKVERIIACSIFVFVAVIIFSVFSFVSLGKARRKQAKYDDAIASLRQEESALKNNLEYMRSPEYLESQARNHLGMIQEDENLYIFK